MTVGSSVINRLHETKSPPLEADSRAVVFPLRLVMGPMRATRFTPLILFDLIILTIFYEEWKL